MEDRESGSGEEMKEEAALELRPPEDGDAPTQTGDDREGSSARQTPVASTDHRIFGPSASRLSSQTRGDRGCGRQFRGRGRHWHSGIDTVHPYVTLTDPMTAQLIHTQIVACHLVNI